MSSAGRVLIIDDDPFIQELLCESLAPLGYQCAVAERGQQALELLRTGRFDVAILDIMLPEINGIEILRRVQNKIPHTEIIVLTGHASLETAIESLRLGAYDYATKPFSIDAIRTTIKRAIEKQRLETRLAAIQDLSREMTLSLDVERVAEAVLDIVTRVLELEHCELFSLDRERNELSPLMVRSVLETPLPCLPLNGDKANRFMCPTPAATRATFPPGTGCSPNWPCPSKCKSASSEC
jgi:DNA-binding response OmpR family regulator